MIKIKIEGITQVLEGLTQLEKQDFPISLAYRIGRIQDKMKSEQKAIFASMEKLYVKYEIKKQPHPSVPNMVLLDVPEKNKISFGKDMQELNEQEIEIDTFKVKLSAFLFDADKYSGKINPSVFSKLFVIIDEDISLDEIEAEEKPPKDPPGLDNITPMPIKKG